MFLAGTNLQATEHNLISWAILDPKDFSGQFFKVLSAGDDDVAPLNM
jgi:hypothetical protein